MFSNIQYVKFKICSYNILICGIDYFLNFAVIVRNKNSHVLRAGLHAFVFLELDYYNNSNPINFFRGKKRKYCVQM